MASQQKPFQKFVTQHAWNADLTQIAISPNSEEVHIYDTSGKTDSASWGKTPKYVLKEHSGYISGIDWNPVSNLIVTSGHDRNAYVWRYEAKEDAWKPTLVILRINRAATSVKWSPQGNKFAVTSGAKCIPVCHFEESNDWWISKMIKKHKSTVLQVAWSPNNKFVVTGACDFKCRILSAYIEGLDDATEDDFNGMWPKAHAFGNVLAEFDQAKAWVNDVAWSPNGQSIAFVGHGSTLTVSSVNGTPNTIYSPSLPFAFVEFLDDGTILAVGFDMNPHIFTGSGDDFKLKGKLDEEKDEGTKKKAGGNRAFGSAFAKFNQADSKGGKFGAKKGENAIKTFHKNHVTCVGLLSDPAKGSVTQFSTSGLDGRLLVWKN